MERPSLKVGPNWMREIVEKILDYAESLKPVSGIGTQVSDSPGGRIVNAQGGSASETTTTHPLKCINASGGTGGNKIRVVYGLLAGEPVPGMSPGDDPPFILSVGSTGVIYGHVTIDISTNPNGTVTAREITSGSSVPANDSTNGYVQLASFSTVEDSFKVVPSIGGSQAYQYCGGNHIWGLQ